MNARVKNSALARLLLTSIPMLTAVESANSQSKPSVDSGMIDAHDPTARKSFDLFMDDWLMNQHNNEQYIATGGKAKADPHYTFGALLPLIATEE